MTTIDVGLFLAGFVSWTISTLSAGGGSILIVAAIAALLRGHAIAPVITFASFVASPARIIFFWHFIEWRVVWWYVPGATAGAILGGWAFTHAGTQLIQVFLGLFLVSTFWQYRLGDRSQSFRMRLHWFLPVSFVSGLTSAVVGASGLLANPFYLNYGLVKERMLATRAVNSLAIQVVKISCVSDLRRAELGFGPARGFCGCWCCSGHMVDAPVGASSRSTPLSPIRSVRDGDCRVVDPVAAAHVDSEPVDERIVHRSAVDRLSCRHSTHASIVGATNSGSPIDRRRSAIRNLD